MLTVRLIKPPVRRWCNAPDNSPRTRAKRRIAMKTLTSCIGLLACVAVASLASFHAPANAESARAVQVVLQENEQIIRDQLIILVDESATIGTGRIFRYEKELAENFTASMPNGNYKAGIKSFAGVPSHNWVQVNLRPFSRADMTEGAADLEPLGHTTPLHRAIYSQRTEVSGIGGRGALLVFSDGMVRNDEEVLQALRDLKVEHGGELCVFTVQVGNSDSGRALLQKMATVNGCGKFYDGDNLNSASAMNGLVRDIFVGPRAVAQVAAAPDRPAAPVAFSLDNVHFENDIHVVHPQYATQLDEVATTMRNNPGLRLRLHGHTDSNASIAYNQALSERRVNAVAAALTQRGVASSRIETRAHGELQPAVPNTTPQNMHMNRRVELTPIQ